MGCREQKREMRLIYSLFIERPRTGATPVPYGPFLKTKLLAEAEAWVAAPVLSAKAAANVREGDMFTARYPDTKLRDERGPISRVAAFGRVTPTGVDVYTKKGGPGNWLWSEGGHGSDLLGWAAGVPRQVLVFAACQVARTALKYVKPETEKRPLIAITTAEEWAKGKKSLEDVEMAANSVYAYAAANDYAAQAAAHAAHAAYSTSSYAVRAADNAIDAGTSRTASRRESARITRRCITLPEVDFAHIPQ